MNAVAPPPAARPSAERQRFHVAVERAVPGTRLLRTHWFRLRWLRFLPATRRGFHQSMAPLRQPFPFPSWFFWSEVSAPHSLSSSLCLLLGPKEPRALHQSSIWWPLAAAARWTRTHRCSSPLPIRRRLGMAVGLPLRIVRSGLAIRDRRGVQQDG